jgi:hypothetical protein
VSYDAGPLDRGPELDRFSGDEAALTLRWSVEYAQGQQFLAEGLLTRLPGVFALLVAGRLDLAKAAAFHSALVPVADEFVEPILARTLEQAPRWTLDSLQRRLRYWIHKLDPGAARQRQQQSVAQRRVWARLDEHGTATMGGSQLPPDRTAAAHDRVDAMARAARADGDPRTLSQLRADVYLDLLSGVVFQLRPSRDPLTEQADTTHPTRDPDHRDDRRLVADNDHHRAGGDRSVVADNDHHRVTGTSGVVATSDHSRAGGDAVADHVHDRAGDGGSVVAVGDHDPAVGAGAGGGGGVPGLLADWDWLWQVGFTDAAGQPLTTTAHSGPAAAPRPGDPSGGAWIRREWRPGTDPAPVAVSLAPNVDPAWAAAFTAAKLCSCGGLRPPPRGGVHLLTKLTTLMCLDDDPAWIPGWGPVIADIARQVAHEQETRPPWHFHVTDTHGNLLHHGRVRRRPTRSERAFIAARDQTCRMPGCTKTALHCDQDHRHHHAHGGPAHRGNLCSLCPHHHALRHEHGYVFHQISLGTYLIESPSGRRWLITPDGHLILTADGPDPGPPPGYTAAILENHGGG